MSRDSGSAAIVSDIEARIQILVGELDRRLYADEAPMSAGALQVLEQSLHGQTRELADLITAVQVQEALDSDGLKEEARQFAGLQPGRLKNQGYRSVNVRFIGGTVIALKVTYYARSCDTKKAAKKVQRAVSGALPAGYSRSLLTRTCFSNQSCQCGALFTGGGPAYAG
jgi:hypothetical protein